MYTFITKNGEIRHLRLGDIGASWQKMHNIHVERMTRQEKDFLDGYGLKTTIFNVANLREFSAVQLYDHDVQTALEHGAIDKRGEQA